ncbi:cadherin-like beta sandwich domain-containing protein [uncultured Clostridium sp.]|uniref:N-acetylmuramoyl-L-alanine amidase family protein n=1 Tax=uncultured Clostridium sp. TaxID=59620 RepID=UPI0025E73204|nr:cadherin-like beta sandwich domain-containing protein [uncultured Clostridium sp.]
MGKIKRRFISMLIVIASIMTMLPIQFLLSEESAFAANPDLVADSINALPVSAYIDQFKVYAEGKANALQSVVDSETGVKHYTSDSYIKPFYLTLPDVHTKSNDEIVNAKINELNSGNGASLVEGLNTYTVYAVTNLDVSVTRVNEISSEAVTSDGRNVLETLGIRISNPQSGTTNNEVIKDSRFIKVSDMPVGVNKLKYDIKGELRTIKYTVNVTKNSEGNLVAQKVGTPNVTSDPNYTFITNSNIVINNGTSYAGGNQDPISLEFNQFIGVSDVNSTNIADYTTAIDKEETKYNNSKPLLYNAKAMPNEGNNMQYEWQIKNSLTALFYKIGINDVTSIGNATVDVYINGHKSITDVSGNTITGFLGSDNLASQDQFVVIGLNMDNQNSASLSKCYSVEIKYPNSDSDTDYSLSNAGILKAQSQDDESVKAYIGKTFKQIKKKDGSNNSYTEYSGTFYVDPRAAKISMVPVLISNKVEFEFYKTVIQINSTTDREEETKVSGATMNDGYNEYYDFSGKNPKFKVDIKDKSSGKLVARYIYDVQTIENGDNVFDVDFIFDDNDGTDENGTYLTTEGSTVKKTFAQAKNNDNRTTFNLYPQPKGKGNVKIALQNRTSNNEYFKVWISDSVTGSDYVEAEESKKNTIDPRTGLRKSTLNIDYSTSKRIMVQAYYDKLEDVEDETGNITKVVSKSYPLDKKYTFYLPDNINESDSDNTIKSDEAALNNIKIKGQNIYNVDLDKNGFSSDSYNYRVTVPKNSTTAVLTVSPKDENVKSITAKVVGSADTSYELFPNKATELMLNSSGITDLEIVVTAQDGTTTKQYNLSILNNTKGENAKLKNLILSSGEYTFDPDEFTTKVQVESSVSSISITPIAEDSKAKVTVNGQKFTGKPINISLAGKQSKEVDIEVESEDGASTTTYTLKIKRVSVIEDDNNGNQGITEDIYYDHDNKCWVDTSKYDEWGVVNNRVMYFDKRGRQVKDRWIHTGKKWYYLNEAGYRATGWKVDNETGQRYYMDNTTGEMKLGMMYLNGSWYYLGTTGVMHTGWLWLNNNWYYFTENGEMITNKTMVIDGKEYRFSTDGRIY